MISAPPKQVTKESLLAPWMNDEYEAYRDTFRKFLQREFLPNYEQWQQDGMVPVELWRKAGEAGFVAPWVDVEYGGSGGDFIHSCIVMEEIAAHGIAGWAASLHSDIIVPYIYQTGTEEQKKKWLPGLCDGSRVSSIAMTEPDAGSDLKAIRTTAILDGDEYVINGSKTFISNGQTSNFCVVVARTNPEARMAENGISLIVVEGENVKGWQRGRNLEKIGMKAQDTSELIFEDCRVPKENLLGKEGHGFRYLMQQLSKERLVLSVSSTAAIGSIIDMTIQYVKERKAFGQSISKFQNTQFELAEMATQFETVKAFVQKCIQMQLDGKKYVKEASMAKLISTDTQVDVVNRCLQLYGGYGYMMEYPIAKAYIDSRVQTIYAGTNEIMKGIIATKLGL